MININDEISTVHSSIHQVSAMSTQLQTQFQAFESGVVKPIRSLGAKIDEIREAMNKVLDERSIGFRLMIMPSYD